MSTPLRQNPCLHQCNWISTGRLHDDLPLFMCTGCKSEWVRTEGWTPCNVDGRVPAGVQAERNRAPLP